MDIAPIPTMVNFIARYGLRMDVTPMLHNPGWVDGPAPEHLRHYRCEITRDNVSISTYYSGDAEHPPTLTGVLETMAFEAALCGAPSLAEPNAVAALRSQRWNLLSLIGPKGLDELLALCNS